MKTLLILFWTFFKIGLFTIGGGYAMIPLIKQEALAHGWVSTEALIDYLAISESTPGPFAVNCATIIGFKQMGILGAICATLGVILPSFIIILLISKILKSFINNRFVQGALKGVKPVVIALIFTVAFGLIWNGLFGNLWQFNFFDWKALIIMAIAFVMTRFKYTKNPILIIVVGAALGLLMYGVIK